MKVGVVRGFLMTMGARARVHHRLVQFCRPPSSKTGSETRRPLCKAGKTCRRQCKIKGKLLKRDKDVGTAHARKRLLLLRSAAALTKKTADGLSPVTRKQSHLV